MSSIAYSAAPLVPSVRLRDVLLPKEHGSWPLACEPLALGLLVAPSVAGGALALMVLAGFFARRPLKIAWRERTGPRGVAARRALIGCMAVGAIALAGALSAGGAAWLVWLLPFAAAGAVFLYFDLKNGGREEAAEIAGAAAFATVPAALAAAAGCAPLLALALMVAMLGRAVPAVMFVRACVRGGKTGVYRAAPPLLTGVAALALAAGLAVLQLMPLVVPVALALFLIRAAWRLLKPTPIRARTLGFQELAIGLAYIAIVAAAWRI